MRFNLNASIFDHIGNKVGTLQHVVLHPDSREITHLIVRKRFFFNLFKDDRVLPESLVALADGDEIHLYAVGGSFETLPKFEEVNFVPMHETDAVEEGSPNTLNLYPRISGAFGSPSLWGPPPSYVTEIKKNIPPGTVAIEEDARVSGALGQDLGRLVEIISDPTKDEATNIVFENDAGDRKQIPSKWVKVMSGNTIQLNVNAELIDKLPESYFHA